MVYWLLHHYDMAELIENKEEEWGERIEGCGEELG